MSLHVAYIHAYRASSCLQRSFYPHFCYVEHPGEHLGIAIIAPTLRMFLCSQTLVVLASGLPCVNEDTSISVTLAHLQHQKSVLPYCSPPFPPPPPAPPPSSSSCLVSFLLADTGVVLQTKAAQGRDPKSTPLHVCQCPNCFTAFAKANGVIECVPKCDLATCDEDTGVCSEGGGKGVQSALSGAYTGHFVCPQCVLSVACCTDLALPVPVLLKCLASKLCPFGHREFGYGN